MIVDLSNVQENGGGKYLEPGDHVVRIFDLAYRDAGDKPVVDVTFKGQAGEIKDTFWLTERALWRLKNLAAAAGIDSPDWSRFDTEELRGKAVTVKVVKETSAKDGKMYSKVKDFWAGKIDDADPWDAPEFASSNGNTGDPF
jgi:hypothetical protein